MLEEPGQELVLGPPGEGRPACHPASCEIQVVVREDDPERGIVLERLHSGLQEFGQPQVVVIEDRQLLPSGEPHNPPQVRDGARRPRIGVVADPSIAERLCDRAHSP